MGSMSTAKHDSIRAAVVKSIRAQRRSVTEVAATAGVARNTLYRYCANQRDMTGEPLSRVMWTLRVHLARRDSNAPMVFQPLRELVTHYARTQEWATADLAERAGLDKGSVSRYLRGDRDLSGEKISRLLKVLGIRVAANLSSHWEAREWIGATD